MKAAVVTAFDRPLVVVDRPVPVPGEDQALVRIEASGLCHTDIHAGHEGVGLVDLEVRKLDEINGAIEDVLAGRVIARVVLQP